MEWANMDVTRTRKGARELLACRKSNRSCEKYEDVIPNARKGVRGHLGPHDCAKRKEWGTCARLARRDLLRCRLDSKRRCLRLRAKRIRSYVLRGRLRNTNRGLASGMACHDSSSRHSALKSAQSGFTARISRNFFARLHFLISFSLAIA
jgi:hypothetical protein